LSATVVELGRALVCSSFGTEQVGAGWPSVVLELTARAFDLGGRQADAAARRLRVGRRFLATMLVASAGELASAFGWPRRCRRRAGGAGGARRGGGGSGRLPARA
jgi:hypothetical protein